MIVPVCDCHRISGDRASVPGRRGCARVAGGSHPRIPNGITCPQASCAQHEAVLPAVEVLRYIAVFQLCYFSLAIAFSGSGSVAGCLSAAFALSVVAHLLAPLVGQVGLSEPVVQAVLLGALFPTPLFWLLTAALFDDRFRFRRGHAIVLGLVFGFGLFFTLERRGLLGLEIPAAIASIYALLPQLPLAVFVVLALKELLRERNADLVEWRIRLRRFLLVAFALVISVVLVAELILGNRIAPTWLELLKMCAILSLVGLWQFWLFPIRRELLDAPKARIQSGQQETTPSVDQELHARLDSLLKKERVFLKEGLTIGQLARTLGTQEYRLRRLINAGLGFRNFNQFLNTYRIAEACRLLADPASAELPIVRIAFDLGYQSLAPFNQAFREITGTTPSAFRRSPTDGFRNP